MDYIINRIERIQDHLPEYFHHQLRKQMFNLFMPQIHLKYNFDMTQEGGHKPTQKEFYQKYKGYEFRIFIDKTENDITITIRTHETSPSDCIIIAVDLKDRNAIIHGLSHYNKCTKPFIEQGKGGGSILLKFALGIIKVNKDIFNIDRIILEDNAQKDCNNCDKKRLSNLYFLMNGNTWYGKYGFRPYDKNDQISDKKRIKKYIRNQKIIEDIKVKDIPLVKYMNDAIIKHNIKNIDMDILGPKIESLGNEPLSSIIKVLMDGYNSFCCIFAHIINKIYKKLGMYQFYGESFYVDVGDMQL